MAYHFPTTTEGERVVKIGKSKSGRSCLREESKPRASSKGRCKLDEERIFHPFVLRNLGGTPSGATAWAKKPPPWWRWIWNCWYMSFKLKGIGFLSLKTSPKQHVVMSSSLEHLYAFLNDRDMIETRELETWKYI